MRSVVFIPVRLSSSRLPRKHFYRIGDKTLIEWVIERVQSTQYVEEVVLCAPKADPVLESIAKQAGAQLFVYSGDEDDVVGRLTHASREYEADICVLCSGDCPLLSPHAIDQLIHVLREDPTVGKAHFAPHRGIKAIHEGIRVERQHVWERANELSTTYALREHQFPIIDREPQLFPELNPVYVKVDELFYSVEHRISVDTADDLTFMSQIYEQLKQEDRAFNLENALELLLDRPQLKQVNQNVVQRRVEDPTYSILVVVDRSVKQETVKGFAHFAVQNLCATVELLVEEDVLKKGLEPYSHKVFGDELQNCQYDYIVLPEKFDLPKEILLPPETPNTVTVYTFEEASQAFKKSFQERT